jgi:hypothetical protein
MGRACSKNEEENECIEGLSVKNLRKGDHLEDPSVDWRKAKLSRYRPEQAHGRSGRLRPQIFLTFGAMEVVGRQPYAPAGFTPRNFPGTHI